MKQNNIVLKDTYNKKIILDKENDDFQVMMEWEKPYMEALIKHLKPFGHVLEIGFGLGYSANAIQKNKIKSHTIIESDKNIIKKLKIWAKKQKNKVIIIEGFWQEQLHKLDKFDSIFCDDCPSKKYPDKENIRGYDFFYKILENHANVNARMTWYCDRPIYWLCHPFIQWSLDKYFINIPNNCNYIKNKNNKTLYLPLIVFTNGTIKDILHPIALGNKSLEIIKL
jgi:hypothetical protein